MPESAFDTHTMGLSGITTPTAITGTPLARASNSSGPLATPIRSAFAATNLMESY